MKLEEILFKDSYKLKIAYRGYDFNEGKEIIWNEINIFNSNDYLEIQKNFQGLIDKLKKLNHPNIINYITGWLEEEKVIFISEFINVGIIRKKINYTKLSIIKKWIIQLLNGIKYLQSKNIHYNYLNCDNIFLDQLSGDIKIGDIGLYEIIHKWPIEKNLQNNKYKIQQIFSSYDEIFSFGICILELVTNEKPYKECETYDKIIDYINRNIYPESLNMIDNKELVNFIKLCLSIKDRRPSIDELINNEFLHDLVSEDNNYPIKIKTKKPISLPRKDKINSSEMLLVVDKNNLVKRKENSPVIENNNTPKNSSNIINKAEYKSSHFSPTLHKNEIKSNNKISIKETENPNEIEVSFIIKKDDWKNKKLLKCPFNLKSDTVEGVVNELNNAINLSNEDLKEIKSKLMHSIKKFKYHSKSFQQKFKQSQRNSILQKEKYETFLKKFNTLSDKLQLFLQSDVIKELDKFNQLKLKKNFIQKDLDIMRILDDYQKKNEIIKNFIHQKNII